MKLILEQHEPLMQIVPSSKIYALIAHEGTTYPFIVYSRSSIVPQYNKDLDGDLGHVDTVQLTIDCHGNTYTQSVEVANELRNALEGYGYNAADMFIDKFRLVSAYEATDGAGDFMQVLVFETTTQTKIN